MLDHLILATQLALENVDTNEMKSVMERAYTKVISDQPDQVNNMLNHESVNALAS